MRRYLLLFILLLSMAGCAKANSWDTALSKLLFGLRSSLSIDSAFSQLSHIPALRQDTFVVERVEPGYHESFITLGFSFSRHPQFTFPFDSGAIVIDTSASAISQTTSPEEISTCLTVVEMRFWFPNFNAMKTGAAAIYKNFRPSADYYYNEDGESLIAPYSKEKPEFLYYVLANKKAGGVRSVIITGRAIQVRNEELQLMPAKGYQLKVSFSQRYFGTAWGLDER